MVQMLWHNPQYTNIDQIISRCKSPKVALNSQAFSYQMYKVSTIHNNSTYKMNGSSSPKEQIILDAYFSKSRPYMTWKRFNLPIYTLAGTSNKPHQMI